MASPGPSIAAFLSLIAWSEGTSRSPLTVNNGYDVIVTSVLGPAIFTDYSDHPFAPQFNRQPIIVRANPLLESTAAGRYQLLYRWWVPYKVQLQLADYSPASQDAVAIEQIKERGGIALIAAGDIQGAIAACANIWASFPGNDDQQGGNTMAALLDQYQVLTA